ncbi:MATE family efflux transporter [Candidatus Woesearchaeota archaeon]|nr:MATE family efflux transporter [Candidatus Woesearchaeota archaeon]
MQKNRVDEFIKNPKKALIKLAMPMIIVMVVQTMYNIVDTAFVGRLGADAIAALTFSFPLFFILISINSGISAGITSRISRYMGEKNKEQAENTAVHGLLISITCAVLVFTIGFLSLKPLFIIFGASDSVIQLGISYMSVILISVFFMFPAYILHSIFSSQGDTKTPMKIWVFTLLVNIALDPIFIYVLGFGVKGAAIATLISYLLALTLFTYYFRKKSYLKIRIKSFKFSFRILREIFNVGAPASLTMLLMSVYIMFLNRFMAHFGTDYVAAFGIVSRLESVAIMPIVAMSMSLLTIIGMFYGAKRLDLIKNISWYGIKISILFTSAVGFLFFLFSPVFLRIFTSEPALIAIASKYLRIEVLTFPLMAVSMNIARIIQGMGFGLPGFMINLIRIVLIAVPLAYIFVFILGYSYLSIAVAMVLGGIASNIVGIIWLKIKLKTLISK